MNPGGDGRSSRNTALYALAATARALDNAAPLRKTPGEAAMREEAITAAKRCGLKGDFERQWANGWRDGASDTNWPPEDLARRDTAKFDEIARARAGTLY